MSTALPPLPPSSAGRARRGLFSDLAEAFNNLRAQKTRTFLTALGIVFGVGSVIGMLAIGAGAREQSLQFIERLGVRNILVESVPMNSAEERQQRRKVSPGLTERDVRILESNIDGLGDPLAAPLAAPGARAAQACRPHSGAIRRARVLREDPQPESGRRTIPQPRRRRFELPDVRARRPGQGQPAGLRQRSGAIRQSER